MVLVVLEHAELALPGGFIGVDVFFVISGYVISSVLLRDLVHGKLDLLRFWIRRSNRLLPTAAVVLAASAVGTAVLLSPFGAQQQAAATGAAAAVGLGNIALYLISADYFSEHVQGNPFLHTWSLGVEEQFYLFFPLIVLAAFRIGRGRTAGLLWVLSILFGLSFALSTVLSFAAVAPVVSSPGQFAFYMMPTRAWEFGVGAVIAVASSGLARGRWHSTAAVVGLALIGAAALLVEPGAAYPGALALIPVVAAALLLAAGLRSNPISRALSWTPLRRIGDVSYSLYLWHWPVLVFARRLWPGDDRAVLGALAVATVLAVITHRHVETPFRERGRSSTRRALRAPVVAVLAGGTACAVVLGGSLASWADPAVRSASRQLLARPVGYEQCLSTVPVSDRDLGPCTWGADGARPVYLLGDSNAQQFTEAARAAAIGSERRLVVATWGGCPLFDVGLHRPSAATKGSECASYAEDTNRWLRGQARGTVMLAASSEMVLDRDDAFEGSDGGLVRAPGRKAALWTDRLTEQIRSLETDGFDVVLIRTPPHFPGTARTWWHPAECQNSVVFHDPADCAVTLPTQEVDDRQGPVRAAEAAAIAATGARSVDVFDDVCRDGTCTTHRAGTWLYRDGLHVSPRYSEELGALFRRALTA